MAASDVTEPFRAAGMRADSGEAPWAPREMRMGIETVSGCTSMLTCAVARILEATDSARSAGDSDSGSFGNAVKYFDSIHGPSDAHYITSPARKASVITGNSKDSPSVPRLPIASALMKTGSALQSPSLSGTRLPPSAHRNAHPETPVSRRASTSTLSPHLSPHTPRSLSLCDQARAAASGPNSAHQTPRSPLHQMPTHTHLSPSLSAGSPEDVSRTPHSAPLPSPGGGQRSHTPVSAAFRALQLTQDSGPRLLHSPLPRRQAQPAGVPAPVDEEATDDDADSSSDDDAGDDLQSLPSAHSGPGSTLSTSSDAPVASRESSLSSPSLCTHAAAAPRPQVQHATEKAPVSSPARRGSPPSPPLAPRAGPTSPDQDGGPMARWLKAAGTAIPSLGLAEPSDPVRRSNSTPSATLIQEAADSAVASVAPKVPRLAGLAALVRNAASRATPSGDRGLQRYNSCDMSTARTVVSPSDADAAIAAEAASGATRPAPPPAVDRAASGDSVRATEAALEAPGSGVWLQRAHSGNEAGGGSSVEGSSARNGSARKLSARGLLTPKQERPAGGELGGRRGGGRHTAARRMVDRPGSAGTPSAAAATPGSRARGKVGERLATPTHARRQSSTDGGGAGALARVQRSPTKSPMVGRPRAGGTASLSGDVDLAVVAGTPGVGQEDGEGLDFASPEFPFLPLSSPLGDSVRRMAMSLELPGPHPRRL